MTTASRIEAPTLVEGETKAPRAIKLKNPSDTQYHEYECIGCGELARNTYCKPHRTDMLARRLCFQCNYWRDFEKKLEADHGRMTIIAGHIYGPGDRTSGSFRGMSGRRFDIEYVEPSIFAGKRITTFDLWSGSSLPEALAQRFPDTARFLDGATHHQVGETGCWNPSEGKSEPYPLPRTLGGLK